MIITRLQSARWLLAELTVVVVGILLAFQVEEWRTARSNEQLIGASLEAMLTDLEDDYSQLALFEELVQDQIRAQDELLKALLNGESREEPWIADRYRASLIYRTWLPNAPTYNALVASGNRYLISDRRLNEAMESYDSYTEYLTTRLARYLGIRERLLRVSLRDIFRLPNYQDPTDFASDPVYLVKPVADFPRHPEFIGALAELARDTASLPVRFQETMRRNTVLREEIKRYLDAS